jgi:hypothetical protein
MSLWNPDKLTLQQMRERDVAEVHVKFSAGQAWPKEVNGDVVLLEYGYSAFLHDHKYGFVE